MEISPAELFDQMRGTVRRLSLPAEEQLAWLGEPRYPVDELGLQLGDAVPLWFERLTAAGLFDVDAEQSLLALDAALRGISGPANAALWSPDGLRSRPEWAHIRLLAGRAYRELERCAGQAR